MHGILQCLIVFKYKLISFILFYLLLSTALIDNYGMLNMDGALYLNLAKIDFLDNYVKIFSTYNWPFFSILINQISNILNLSLINAAYSLNFIFSALLIIFFIKIIKFIYKNRNIQKNDYLFYIPFFVLTSSIPIFDDYLFMVIRDNGFWAFLLPSLYYLLKFLKFHETKFLLFSIILSILCFLMRVEGVVVLIINLYLLLRYSAINIYNLKIAQLNKYLILSLISLLILLFSYFIFKIEKVNQYYFSFYKFIINESFDLLFIKKFILYFANYFFLFLKKLNFLYLFFIYFLIKNKTSNIKFFKLLIFIALVFFAFGFINYLLTNQLSARYLIPTILIFLIFSSLGIYEYVNDFFSNKNVYSFKSKLIAIVLFLNFIISYSAILFDKPKIYNIDYQVANWVKTNFSVDGLRLYSSNVRVHFYIYENDSISIWEDFDINEVLFDIYDILIIEEKIFKKINIDQFSRLNESFDQINIFFDNNRNVKFKIWKKKFE